VRGGAQVLKSCSRSTIVHVLSTHHPVRFACHIHSSLTLVCAAAAAAPSPAPLGPHTCAVLLLLLLLLLLSPPVSGSRRERCRLLLLHWLAVADVSYTAVVEQLPHELQVGGGV